MQDGKLQSLFTAERLDAISKTAGNTFLALLADQFPPPDEALGHEQRQAMVSALMASVRNATLEVGIAAGIDERSLADTLDAAFPYIETLIVTTGTFHAVAHTTCAHIFNILYQVILQSSTRYFSPHCLGLPSRLPFQKARLCAP